MPDIQTNEAVEKAKEKLQDVESRKGAVEGRPQPATDGGKTKSKNDIIRPAATKPKKKKFGTKLKEAFFGENISNGTIADNIFFNIFIPKLKTILSEMANSAINSALGLDSRTRTFSGGVNTHQANASNYRDRNFNRPTGSYGTSRREAISEITWDGATANDIYNQMSDIIDQFPDEGLTIADVYSMMDMGDRIRSTDRDWGWRSMRGIDLVCIDQSRDLWIIDMPAARPL